MANQRNSIYKCNNTKFYISIKKNNGVKSRRLDKSRIKKNISKILNKGLSNKHKHDDYDTNKWQNN